MPKKDYTEDFLKLSQQFYEASIQQTEMIKSMKEAVEDINHNNVLHLQAEQRTAQQLQAMTTSLDDFKKFLAEQVVGLVVQVFKWIIIALIVLAGVKAAAGLFGIKI